VLKPKKSLGQNFLQDENILRKITESLSLSPEDVLLEIGPGQGALTKYVSAKTERLIAIEVDQRAVQVLQERFQHKIDIVHQDILDVDLQKLSEDKKAKLRIVGNIPYHLTSEILFWMYESHQAVLDATIMMQLEVARRLVARPKNKEYGILAVCTQLYTDCEMLFKVSRNCFFPKPDVDSAVVRLRFKKNLPSFDEQLFRSIVRATFGKRRKTLRNGLKSMEYEDEALGSLDFDLQKRPEELSVQEFLVLTDALGKITKNK
jgi:16S rRNA (adenine1518-N6/adenine1519-N6)-dimethyltransferase